MKRLILLLLCLFLTGAAAPPACIQPATWACEIADADALSLGAGITEVSRTVTVPASALPLERPLTVRIAALASSEVLWNGRRIGGSGTPGESRARERPGRYFAVVTVPPALLRPGDNVVTVRMSAQHLWLPVFRPVHMLLIGLYETPQLPGRSEYLPALLALGAIAAAFLYFALSAFGRGPGREARRDWRPALLAGIAGTAALQLLIEVSRAFIAYSYPWHLVRVSTVAIAAAATAVCLAAYAADRFAPSWRRRATVATSAATLAALVLVPAFDFKAMGATLAGVVALAACAGHALRRDGDRAASLGIAAAMTAVALMLWEATSFLDRSYYLLTAACLLLLVAEQVGAFRAARAEAQRAAGLEERLRRAEESGEPILGLKDGSRSNRVAQADILFVRGADDYCEVTLKDGRVLLVTNGLARLHEQLPDSFARVHKSYVVNKDEVRRLEPRPGGGRLIRLDGGAAVPVGRSYAAAVAGWAK